MTLLLQMHTACQTGEPAIFVLPEGYTGYVIIIYDQENGVAQKYKDKSRLYEIPETGILKTQFKNNPGWTDFPKFYYKKVTSENQLSFTMDAKNLPADTIVAFGGSSGYVSKDIEGKEGIRYVQYFIGTEAQIDTAYKEAEKLDIAKLAD